VRNAASPYEVIDVRWEATTTAAVTLDFSAAPGSNSIRVTVYAAVAVTAYTDTIGDGTATSFTVTHGLGTRDVVVVVRNAASPYEVIDVRWEATATGTVTLDFSAAPGLNSTRVAVYSAVAGTAHASTIGDGSATSFTVTHGLGTRDIVVVVRNAASPYEVIDVRWEATTTAAATLIFSAPPALNTIKVAVYSAVPFDISTRSIHDLSDVTISSATNGDFLRYNGTVWINDPVNLSTDTIGDYVSTITGGTGVTSSAATIGEGTTHTLSIGQAVGTSSNVTFGTVTAALTGNVTGNLTGNVTGNLTGNITGSTTVGANLTVTGDLIIQGTTVTLNTETLAIEDNIITLNSNVTGTPSANGGVEIERGTSDNASILWNETSDTWTFSPDNINFKTIAPIESPTFTGTVTIPSGASISGFALLAGPTFTGTVVLPATTSIGTVSSTELGYVDGVTSAIQTQLNAKSATLTDAVIIAGIGGDGSNGQAIITNGAGSLSFSTIIGTTEASIITAVGVDGAAGQVLKTNGAGDLSFGDVAEAQVTGLTTALGLKAPLASPTFTGTVTIPTGASITLPTVAGGVNHSGSTSGTTKLLAAAAAGTTTITMPATTGTMALTSDITGTNSGTNTGDNATNTQYSGLAASKADIASPTFTGTVTIPTGASITLPTVAGGVNHSGSTSGTTKLLAAAAAGTTTITMPATTGTMALTSDITGTNSGTNTGDNATNTQYSGLAASKADIASPTFTGTVTVPTPTNATDAVTKGYADALKQGLDIKDSVRVASTVNIAVATALINASVIDGITVATGDRVLLKDQTAGAENGIYIVVASGAASRSADADSSAEVTSGLYTFVSQGTAAASMGFVLTTADPITLATTALTFTQFSGAGQVIAGAGLTKTGNTLDAVGTANRIVVAADAIDIGTDVVTLTGTQTLTNKTLTAPTITGTSIAPTATAGDSTTQIATTAFVTAAVAASIIVSAGTAILDAIIDAKGDLIVGASADTPARLEVGANGYFLKADSAAETGVAWDAIDLGTDTTGNYVGTITAGTGVSSSAATTGEGTTHTLSIGQDVATSAAVTFGSVATGAITFDSGTGELNTSTQAITLNTATTVDSFALATYRTAKYLVQVTQGTKYTSSEVLLAHDGTVSYLSEYAVIELGASRIPLTIATSVSGANIILTATITNAATTSATVKVARTLIAV